MHLKDLDCTETVQLWGHFGEGCEDYGRMWSAMYLEDRVPERHRIGKGNLEERP